MTKAKIRRLGEKTHVSARSIMSCTKKKKRERRNERKKVRGGTKKTNGSSVFVETSSVSLVSSSHVASTSFRSNACLEGFTADAYALFVLQMHPTTLPSTATAKVKKETEDARSRYLTRYYLLGRAGRQKDLYVAYIVDIPSRN